MHAKRTTSSAAFTLIEVLVVVGIIGLLIAVALPSMNAARIASQKTKVKGLLSNIEQGLELFHNEFDEYPESAKAFDRADATNGEYTAGNDGRIIYGAQRLARAMYGRDLKGYVDPVKARKIDDRVRDDHTLLYDNQEDNYNSRFERSGPYMTETDVLKPVNELKGTPNLMGNGSFNADLDDAPVIIDAFDTPVLYYRANPRGKYKIVTDDRTDSEGFALESVADNNGNPAVPYYSHVDNAIFTGLSQGHTLNEGGWRFGVKSHQIKEMGDKYEPDDFADEVPGTLPDAPSHGYTMPWSKYIHDHKVHESGSLTQKPLNPETYLLISPGFDGEYGTPDDVNNFGG